MYNAAQNNPLQYTTGGKIALELLVGDEYLAM